jgi:hypothetical protein
MPVPATNGQEKMSIADMQVGDYIAMYYDSTLPVGQRYLVGNNGKPEMPTDGHSDSSFGYWFFIKVDKGLLIADRNIQHSIAWGSLNSEKLIQGQPNVIDGINGIIRCLSGGVAFADTFGNISGVNYSLGAYPVDNEWDKYIVNKIYGFGGKGDDNVWHWSKIASWVRDSSSYVYKSGYLKVIRGNYFYNFFDAISGNTSSTTVGFRPVFEYRE